MHAALCMYICAVQPEDEVHKEAAASASRIVNLSGGQPADKTAGFAGNTIKTAKYNIITFFPIFLFEMFSRAAYLYFLAQVGLFRTGLQFNALCIWLSALHLPGWHQVISDRCMLGSVQNMQLCRICTSSCNRTSSMQILIEQLPVY